MHLNLISSVERRKGVGTYFGPVCRPSLLGYREVLTDLVWRAGPEGKAWGGCFQGEKQRMNLKLMSARWSPKAREGMTCWTMLSRAKMGRNRISAGYTNDLKGSKAPRLPSMFVQYTKPQTQVKARIKLAWEPLSPPPHMDWISPKR